jgi:hypothetical protein
MLTKSADSLPQKDAQAFKQLAVLFHLIMPRNSTIQKIIKKDLNMHNNCWQNILIILKQSQ